MKYCPKCNNMLKSRKNMLVCEACGEEYDLNEVDERFYTVTKEGVNPVTTEHKIVQNPEILDDSITSEDRNAHESYFGTPTEHQKKVLKREENLTSNE